LAHASALFTWAIKNDFTGIYTNPCKNVERHDEVSRERVLSEKEVPSFWQAFDELDLIQGSALKTLLLTGQRPGEVTRMRREHIEGNWWTLPGQPVPELGWLGTKNSQTHRVYLPDAVVEIIKEIDPDAVTGFVFASERGNPVRLNTAMLC
jgi:integrase